MLCRYCPSCKTDSSEVIGAGEKMRITKKKANMMSKKGSCNRDWGKVREGGGEGRKIVKSALRELVKLNSLYLEYFVY